MTIYVPVHTHCSDCGTFSGHTTLGVGFSSQEDAIAYLREHPNTGIRYGDDVDVIAIQVKLEVEA